MHTEKREDPLVELGYEVRDLNTVAIRNATIGFFIFAIASAGIGFLAYRVMNPTVFETKPSLNNRVVPGSPYPLIQSNMAAKTDIMDIRQHETAVLTAPIGWADPAKTHVHLPIEKAMQIIADKGIKPTGQSVSAVSPGHTPNPAIGEQPSGKSPSSLSLNPNSVTGNPASSGAVTLTHPGPSTGAGQIQLSPDNGSSRVSPAVTTPPSKPKKN